MNNPRVVNPNDFKVVVFKNATDFDFTHDMGCMYDSRPIFGMSGISGIKAGESVHLPYHVGSRLSVNLAKAVLVRGASGKPQTDAQGQPIIQSIWNEDGLKKLAASYLTELYSETKPIAQSETDVLMAKVEELRKLMEEKGIAPSEPKIEAQPPAEPKVEAPVAPNTEVSNPPADPVPPGDAPKAPEGPKVYQDKAEVIAELEKRGIPHDKRQNKANLEKLLIA